MAEAADAARTARQESVISDSEALKVRLMAHTDELDAFVAILQQRAGLDSERDDSGE